MISTLGPSGDQTWQSATGLAWPNPGGMFRIVLGLETRVQAVCFYRGMSYINVLQGNVILIGGMVSFNRGMVS